MLLNWKTIDKLEAVIPGVDNGYKGELCEFDVRLGRSGTPIHLSEHFEERFRIENTKFEIVVEAASLSEAKALLREKLSSSEDYSGHWKLWVKVDVDGGSDKSWRGETASCAIRMDFILELTTRRGGKVRKRHTSMEKPLPVPFVGEYWIPTTHKELSQLRDGPAKPKPETGRFKHLSSDPILEATPELIETIRKMQALLGASGEKVKAAMSKKRILSTLEAVRQSSGTRLLTEGVL